MIHTISVQKMQIDEDDPWSDILSAVAFDVRATVHTMTQAAQTQLVFIRDAIINITHNTYWRYIQDQKQKLICINNRKENTK